MADNFRLTFAPNMMVPQAAAGATFVIHSQRLALAFDDTANESVYLQTVLPPAYTGTVHSRLDSCFTRPLLIAATLVGKSGWRQSHPPTR